MPFLVLPEPQLSPHRSVAEPRCAELHRTQVPAAGCVLKLNICADILLAKVCAQNLAEQLFDLSSN